MLLSHYSSSKDNDVWAEGNGRIHRCLCDVVGLNIPYIAVEFNVFPTNTCTSFETWANRKYHFHTVTGCNLKEGASGGPWLENYNEKTGVGEIRTVTSFGSETEAYLGGPRFDDRAKKLFEEANRDK